MGKRRKVVREIRSRDGSSIAWDLRMEERRASLSFYRREKGEDQGCRSRFRGKVTRRAPNSARFAEGFGRFRGSAVYKLQKFRDELKNRLRVLKRLGHIDVNSVVQLKGRAARLINTGDELLVTELMFNGTFNDLDPHQVVALASCFIPGDKSSDKVFSRIDLAKPLQKLRESARKIADIQRECQLDINVEKYVESAIRPYLIDVIYCWSKGATFAEVIKMTNIFEGSIIRLARQLDVFLNQLKAAAHALGDINLEKKFESGIESLRHGIMFTNSLYL